MLRDPYLPQKPLNEIQAAVDFVILHVLQRNLVAWVHGFLHCRDYGESLVDFFKVAHGNELLVLDKFDPSELRAPPWTRKWLYGSS